MSELGLQKDIGGVVNDLPRHIDVKGSPDPAAVVRGALRSPLWRPSPDAVKSYADL